MSEPTTPAPRNLTCRICQQPIVRRTPILGNITLGGYAHTSCVPEEKRRIGWVPLGEVSVPVTVTPEGEDADALLRERLGGAVWVLPDGQRTLVLDRGNVRNLLLLAGLLDADVPAGDFELVAAEPGDLLEARWRVRP